MFSIADGRKALWQWDLNQKLAVEGSCTEVHFLDRGSLTTLTVEVKDGKADIPNILLQKAGKLVVYAYIIDEQDRYTKVCETFAIAARPKPQGYAYTETEVKTWEDLKADIGSLSDLETEAKDNLVAAINEVKAGGGSADAVLYTEQGLTDKQKKQARDNIGATNLSLGLTSASVGQIIKVKAVDEDGKPTQWEAAEMGGGTTTEQKTKTVSVGTEPVTIDLTATEQTVNLVWNVPGAKSIPAFTNYYSKLNGTTYPRELTAGYNQFWSNNAGHGNGDSFVSGHKYFIAMKYEMDGDSTANYTYSSAQIVSPTNSSALSGTGWLYALVAPSTAGQASYTISGLNGTGRIYYCYCIDVTVLQEAGAITATTVNELAELFGGLELIPGQNYAGSTTSGNAVLTITRNGMATEVASTQSTATVNGGDILAVSAGTVTFQLIVMETVILKDQPWKGKKWVAFGDSLTDQTINATKKYYKYIEEKSGITVAVLGTGGTGYYKTQDSGTAYYQRMANCPADADIITIFGSVNDWNAVKQGIIQAGAATDTLENGTLSGYINECIDVAIEKAPFAQIALVTPMDYHGLPDETLEKIADTIKAVAVSRKIKYLDLYHESGFRVDDATYAAQYTTDYSSTAETYGHPSNLAHEKLIAPEFMELLKRMTLTM